MTKKNDRKMRVKELVKELVLCKVVEGLNTLETVHIYGCSVKLPVNANYGYLGKLKIRLIINFMIINTPKGFTT